MRYPVDSWEKFNITAGNSYGAKVSYGYHSGVDVNGNGGGNSDCGVPLKAISSGVITSVERRNTGYGNHLHYKIEGKFGTRWIHYAHCINIYVKQGDVVSEGQTVATLGSSGNSNYCHLHWEVKKKPTGINGIAKTLKDLADKWDDPIAFVKKTIDNKSGVVEISIETHEKIVTEGRKGKDIFEHFGLDISTNNSDTIIKLFEKKDKELTNCRTSLNEATKNHASSGSDSLPSTDSISNGSDPGSSNEIVQLGDTDADSNNSSTSAIIVPPVDENQNKRDYPFKALLDAIVSFLKNLLKK